MNGYQQNYNLNFNTLSNTTNKPTIKIYPVQQHNCMINNSSGNNSKPLIMTSNDGNRHQKCLRCGWTWNAPK